MSSLGLSDKIHIITFCIPHIEFCLVMSCFGWCFWNSSVSVMFCLIFWDFSPFSTSSGYGWKSRPHNFHFLLAICQVVTWSAYALRFHKAYSCCGSLPRVYKWASINSVAAVLLLLAGYLGLLLAGYLGSYFSLNTIGESCAPVTLHDPYPSRSFICHIYSLVDIVACGERKVVSCVPSGSGIASYGKIYTSQYGQGVFLLWYNK